MTNQTQTLYDDEIDLRDIVRKLLERWYWMAIFAVVAAVAAGVASYVQPEQYIASTSVELVKPVFTFQLGENVTSVIELPDTKSVIELATSNEVMNSVINSIEDDQLELNQKTIGALREHLEVTNSDMFFNLTVEDGNPELAAAIANIWAEELIDKLNSMYGFGEEIQELIDEPTNQAQIAWNVAQNELSKFEESSTERILFQEIEVEMEIYSETLLTIQRLGTQIQEVAKIQERLSERDDSSSKNLIDDIKIISMTSQLLLDVSDPGMQIHLLVQDEIIAMSADDQITFAAELLDLMENKRQTLVESLTGIEESIYALQAKLSEIQAQRAGLEQIRDLALETYAVLTLKATEVALYTQSSTEVVQTFSIASVPTQSVTKGIARNAGMAGFAGVIAGAMAIFIVEWWKDEDE